MSRYIDADDVLKLLDLMYDNQADKDDPYNVGVMGAINYIKHKAPSIEICFCKECKYRYRSGYRGDEYWVCDFMDAKIKPNDFCSYGEREGE